MEEPVEISNTKWTIHQSAALLGISEFSLLSRIQTDDIAAIRASWGEMVLPGNEIERLLGETLKSRPMEEELPILPDSGLGIERRQGGLKRNGEPTEFKVPHSIKPFTASEIQAYRAAFGVIASELSSLEQIRRDLEAISSAHNTEGRQIGSWQVLSRLLSLDQSEILLCQRRNDERDFLVIEKFQHDSPYAKANREIEILLLGKDDTQLVEDFKAHARHTLKFMASNLVAKAQKVVWEQFPDHSPSHVVRAISERCRRAVSDDLSHEEVLAQTLSTDRHNHYDAGRGIHF